MALRKATVFKGIEADYWKIINLQSAIASDETYVTLGLYKDQAAREENIGNTLCERVFRFEGLDYTRETAYAKIKESKMSEAAGIEGEEGYIAPVETNEFVNAEDC